MPSESTFMKWLSESASLSEYYAHAKQRQADYMAHQNVEISDTEPDVNRAKVRIDTRKWLASKLYPQKYGDKLELNGSLETVNRDPQSLETCLALVALLASIDERVHRETGKPLLIPEIKQLITKREENET